MQLALDFDSILWPIVPAMGFRYEDCPTWDHLAVLCGGVKPMLAKFDEVMDYRKMRQTPMIAGAREAVCHFKARGVQVHIMTMRPARFARCVARVLQEAEIPYDRLDCLPDIDKVSLCLQRGIQVLVDDHPQTLRAAHEAGLTAMTLNYLYNADPVNELGLTSADSWAELEPLVLRELDSSARAVAAA
jgi:uncharacterized HAD superfamily protein